MPGSQVSPGFSGEGEVRQFRVVRGTTVSPVNVECMTKELTALAPSSSECSVPLWIGGARKLFVEAHAWAGRQYLVGQGRGGFNAHLHQDVPHEDFESPHGPHMSEDTGDLFKSIHTQRSYWAPFCLV